MKRDDIERQVSLSVPIIVRNRNGKLMYPYKNRKAHETVIEFVVDLIEKILSNEREGLGKHEYDEIYYSCLLGKEDCMHGDKFPKNCKDCYSLIKSNKEVI